MRRILVLLLMVVPAWAWAALPSNEIWREAILSDHVGYGTIPANSSAYTLCTVNTLANTGGSGTTGSLRYCAGLSGSHWIIFSVSGTISLGSSDMPIASNKIIDGRGQNILIQSGRLRATGVSNIILMYLRFQNNFGDSMQFENETQHVWVHHITCARVASDPSDECIDISRNTGSLRAGRDITISWSRFDYTPTHTGPSDGGTILISDPSESEDINNRITLHHNWYNQGYVRHPLARWFFIHSFNNYYDRTDIGAELRSSAKFNSQNDILRLGNRPNLIETTSLGSPAEDPPTSVSVTGALLLDGASFQQVNQGSIFNPASDYSYTLDTANTTLQNAIIAGAGWQSVTAPTGSLVAHWELDEVSGTSATDSSGNGFTGTLTNMSVPGDWVAGKIDGGLNFDGVDGFVATTFTTSLGANPYTWSVWFKATGTTARTDVILAKRPSDGTNQLSLFICGDATCATDGNLLAVFDGSFPSPSRSVNTAGSVLDNAWHKATVVRSASGLFLYLDGALADSDTAAIPTITSTVRVTIGNADNTVTSDEFLGVLDDVRIYDYAQDAAEVLSLYNADICTPIPVVATFSGGGFMYGLNLVTGLTPDSAPPHAGSTLRLFENGVELSPAHSTDSDISTIGLGRFRHACCASEAILWSASNNSNAMTNGRVYAYTDGCTPTIETAAAVPGAPANLRVVSP